MDYFNKKRFFLLITIFCCISLGLSASDSSPTSLNRNDQPTYPKSAATSNYKMDLNITWGYSGYEYAYGIALDDSANIYISGAINSFGYGNYDAFMAKFDSSEDPTINNWGGTNQDWGRDIAVDDAGYIYITGYTLSLAGNGFDTFIAKYDSSGLLQWSKMWDSGADDRGYGIAIDDLGNVYIAGSIEPIGGVPGIYDAFVAKYDSDGTYISNFTWESGAWDYGYDIATNGTDIYITGKTAGMGAGGDDAFIAKFNSTLDSKMNITWGRSNDDEANDITLDSTGNIYITGRTDYAGYHVFIAKFNSTGDSIMNITGHTSAEARGIALDQSGHIYITGDYVNNPNLKDAFISKFDSNGESKTNITWGGSADDYGMDIAVDDSGSIYITGITQSHGNGLQAFIAKYKPVAASRYIPPAADDDDDDTDASVMVRYISIIILA
ncbi:MAG: SBBP repeat-containing protein, partial [Candidatus Neomarinimicrobiota bacterium]